MKERRIFLLTLLTLLLVVGIPTGLLVREYRQERLNRELIASTKEKVTKSNSSSSMGIDQSKAIEIAKKAIADNEKGWGNQWVYEATLHEKGWTVLAERIEGYGWDGKPQFVTGDNRLILIHKNGNITSYFHGL